MEADPSLKQSGCGLRRLRIPPNRWRTVASVRPLATAGLAVAAASVVVPSVGPVQFGSPILGIYAALTPLALLVGTLLGGLALLAGAIVARVRQPRNPVWRLLAVMYFANFLWVLYFIPDSVAWTLAELTVLLDAAVFAHVALAFPFGHIRSPAEARLVRAVYTFAIGISLALLAVWEPRFLCEAYCPHNVLVLSPSDWAADALATVRLLSVPVIGMLLAVLVWHHWREATPPARRALFPVAVAFPVVVLWAAVALPAYLLQARGVVSVMTSPVAAAIVDLVFPAALLAGALRLRMARESVASAVIEMGVLPTLGRLEDALRRRLGDPGLAVLRWSSTRGSFVDEDGRAVVSETVGSDHELTILERDGAPVAAIRHDAALLDDSALIERIRTAAAITLDATEMREQLSARGGDTAGLPSGEVTFLFADLERSTELLESLGDRYADVLTELRRSAMRIAERHHGRVVDARGDELFLAFWEAASAVRAAAELQREVQLTPWPAGANVRLRIGLHSGRPSLSTAGYVGLDVHIAARVMATAHGREIVASGSVLARLDTGEGKSWRALGPVALRGIAEPVALYSTGARTDFDVASGFPTQGGQQPGGLSVSE